MLVMLKNFNLQVHRKIVPDTKYLAKMSHHAFKTWYFHDSRALKAKCRCKQGSVLYIASDQTYA